jgi:HD-like signal output (HDOD) protein
MNLGELVKRVQEVCPLRATAHRIARLCAEQDAPINEVATAIATDPSLAVMTMRIANSAAFGRTRAVSRLEDAIVLIGLAEIERMAMALAMLAAFPVQHELDFGFHDRSTVAGSIARVVAIRTGEVPRGEAFVCGLLCDIGAMACAAVDATEYSGICRLAGGDLATRATLERMRYGATSFEIGGELLRRNNLPELVASAVELSEPRPGTPFLGRLTAFARAASMAIVNAGDDEDFAQLTVRLEAARATSDIAVPVEELERLCIAAAGTAAKAIQGAR